jgi:3-oxoacyl-[acyl-carrier protein] reductase
MRLKDKVAIITGGANGIGWEAVQVFLREGASVAIADFDEANGSVRLSSLQKYGKSAAFIQVNVADRASVDSMVEGVLQRFGKIDILINNAGITRDAMLSKLSVDDFQKVLDVNLTGVFHCTQAVVPAMINQGSGKIINTS